MAQVSFQFYFLWTHSSIFSVPSLALKTFFSNPPYKKYFAMRGCGTRIADDNRTYKDIGQSRQRWISDETGRTPSRYSRSGFEMKIIPSTFSISSLVSRFLTSTCFASLKTFAWKWNPGIDQTWVYHNRHYEIWTWKLHICNLPLVILIPLIHLSSDKKPDRAWKIVKTGLPTFQYIVRLNSENFGIFHVGRLILILMADFVELPKSSKIY